MDDKPGGTQSALTGIKLLKLLPIALCCAFIGHCLGLGDNGFDWELCTIGAVAGFIIGAIIGVFEQRRGWKPKAR